MVHQDPVKPQCAIDAVARWWRVAYLSRHLPGPAEPIIGREARPNRLARLVYQVQSTDRVMTE